MYNLETPIPEWATYVMALKSSGKVYFFLSDTHMEDLVGNDTGSTKPLELYKDYWIGSWDLYEVSISLENE